MIDGSEKRNRRLAFDFQNSHVYEKRSNEDMYTPLARLPQNAPYLPPKILHKPWFSISLETAVMPRGNEKKMLCMFFFMKTFLHNKPPGLNEGLDGGVQMLVVS